MSYEELSLEGFVKEIRDVSEGPHTRKFCFVLGAGASRSSGIKTGQELVNIWDKELTERNNEEHTKWKVELNITEENKYGFYNQYYEKRFNRHPTDGYNFLEKLMEHAKPSSGYVMLSYLLSQTSHNVVITVNFDHLIEDSVNYYNQEIPLVIGHESLAHYVSKQLKRPTVIKIHRDLLFDPANRTDEVETLHVNWVKALDTVFSEYHPIFIGYAGNDNSLMYYLYENRERFKSGGDLNCPYWMLYKSDKLQGKILEFLDQSDGYCVRHSGFDEVLYLIGSAFNYKMQTKEEFLTDAEKRYKALSDAIDGFTDRNVRDNKAVVEDSVIDQAVQQITDQAELQRIYREAVLLHNADKYDEALPLKQKLVDLQPENARYHNSLGATLYQLNRYEEAFTEYQKAVDLDPDNSVYHHGLDIVLYEMKRYDEDTC